MDGEAVKAELRGKEQAARQAAERGSVEVGRLLPAVIGFTSGEEPYFPFTPK